MICCGEIVLVQAKSHGCGQGCGGGEVQACPMRPPFEEPSILQKRRERLLALQSISANNRRYPLWQALNSERFSPSKSRTVAFRSIRRRKPAAEEDLLAHCGGAVEIVVAQSELWRCGQGRVGADSDIFRIDIYEMLWGGERAA